MLIKYNLNSRLLYSFIFSVVMLQSVHLSAQISGSEVKPEKEKKESVKVEKEKKDEFQRRLPPFQYDSLSGSSYYFTALGQYSYRYFKDNSVYNIHEKLNDQKGMITGGVSIGTVLNLGSNFSIDAGLSYFSNGETYSYEDPLTDSSYQYSNVYVQAGIPLKLRYTYGKNFQVFGFAGAMPLNILTIRKRSSYVTAEGVATDEVFTKITQGFTPFNVMLNGGIGLNYYVNYFGITMNVEYRRHMGNTYSEDTFKRVHKMYGIGLNLGITYRI